MWRRIVWYPKVTCTCIRKIMMHHTITANMYAPVFLLIKIFENWKELYTSFWRGTVGLPQELQFYKCIHKGFFTGAVVNLRQDQESFLVPLIFHKPSVNWFSDQVSLSGTAIPWCVRHDCHSHSKHQCKHSHNCNRHTPSRAELGKAHVGQKYNIQTKTVRATHGGAQHPPGLLWCHLCDIDWHHHVEYSDRTQNWQVISYYSFSLTL